MAKCKHCGKEYIQRNTKQLFCTNRKDNIANNCKDKYRRSLDEEFKNRFGFTPKVDELSLMSANIFKG